MPIYEYQCQKCGTFETTQRITEKPLGKCPTCKGKVKKLISNTSFQLKGTGWYVTDYARKDNNKDNNKGAEKGENGGKPSAESKSDSKSDSKGESKTESSSSGSAKSSSTSSSSTSA
jgi:putative FmdB family regulatory protein